MDAQATFSCSFTQSDLDPVVELPSLPRWPAQRLLPQERAGVGYPSARWGSTSLRDWPGNSRVSRKFLYQQVHAANGSQRSLRTLKSTRRRPFLPAGHQGLAAATRFWA